MTIERRPRNRKFSDKIKSSLLKSCYPSIVITTYSSFIANLILFSRIAYNHYPCWVY